MWVFIRLKKFVRRLRRGGRKKNEQIPGTVMKMISWRNGKQIGAAGA